MTRSATSVTSFSASSVLVQFARSHRTLVKAFGDRREIMHLSEFDDRMLRDIGLTRIDVESALAEPIYLNPSWVLVRCAKRDTRAQPATTPARAVRPAVPLVKQVSRCA